MTFERYLLGYLIFTRDLEDDQSLNLIPNSL